MSTVGFTAFLVLFLGVLPSRAQSRGPDGPKPNLELRLQMDGSQSVVESGIPRSFTFQIVNISDHDVRVPTAPSVDCGDPYDGSVWLRIRFTPATPGERRIGSGCAADKINWPPILDRIKQWRLLHPGESLAIAASKAKLGLSDTKPGRYVVWAEYQPPSINAADQKTLRDAGIDFPAQSSLLTPQLTFIQP